MQKCIPSILHPWRRNYIHRVLLLNTPTTSGYIPALPFIRFISQGCLHSSLFQFAWFAICSLQVEGDIPLDESRCFYSHVPLKVFIFSVVWPQHFHSIVTPNKQPDCQSCRPAQPSLLPEVSFVENERLTGCFDIRALSVPLLISPNKRKPDHIQGRVSFSVWRKLKKFPKSPVNIMPRL